MYYQKAGGKMRLLELKQLTEYLNFENWYQFTNYQIVE